MVILYRNILIQIISKLSGKNLIKINAITFIDILRSLRRIRNILIQIILKLSGKNLIKINAISLLYIFCVV